jgi:hypothetical protein
MLGKILKFLNSKLIHLLPLSCSVQPEKRTGMLSFSLEEFGALLKKYNLAIEPL